MVRGNFSIISYGEEDTCMSYGEEDASHASHACCPRLCQVSCRELLLSHISYGEEDTCLNPKP